MKAKWLKCRRTPQTRLSTVRGVHSYGGFTKLKKSSKPLISFCWLGPQAETEGESPKIMKRERAKPTALIQPNLHNTQVTSVVMTDQIFQVK